MEILDPEEFFDRFGDPDTWEPLTRSVPDSDPPHPHMDIYCREHDTRLGGCRCASPDKLKQTMDCPGQPCADAWTHAHPRGTRMLYQPIAGEDHREEVRVRSEAWLLGCGHIVAKVTGRAGGVHITHLEDTP